jgi:hypothetical protein
MRRQETRPRQGVVYLPCTTNAKPTNQKTLLTAPSPDRSSHSASINTLFDLYRPNLEFTIRTRPAD